MPKLNCRVEFTKGIRGSWRVESPPGVQLFSESFLPESLRVEKSLDVKGYSAKLYLKAIPLPLAVYFMTWDTLLKDMEFIINAMTKRYCLLFKGVESNYLPVTDPAVRWMFQTSYNRLGLVLPVDIDGDWRYEVVTVSSPYDGAYIGKVYCLGRDGVEKWEYTLPDWEYWFGVADCDGDGKAEVYVQCWDNYLYCIDSGGSLKWRASAGYIADGSMIFLDVDNDGYLEIITDSPYTCRCFKYTGETLWEASYGNNYSGALASADVNSDGSLEILYGTSRYISVIGLNGVELYQIYTREPVSGLNDNIGISLFDVDGDGAVELLRLQGMC
jgi:hypothetical protein